MTSADSQQGFLTYNLESPDWVAVKALLDEVDEGIVARRSHVLFRVNAWLLAVRVFRRVEERRIVLGEPAPRDFEYHRAFASLLIGHGEILLLELKRHEEIEPEHIGVRFEDIAAHVQDLRYDQRSRYGGMTIERRDEILQEVFSVGE
jgi:hypothetical protein